jgi:hypothetical protein
MTAITIESLGITSNELIDRVVQRVADSVLEYPVYDEDGEPAGARDTAFMKALEKKVAEKIDAAVSAIAGRNVLPNIEQYVENLCLQQTNQWGERTGQKLTFTEYLVQRAEAYLVEPVDYEGRAKGERDAYSWKASGTRVSHIVHKHLQYSIQTAMEGALKTANSKIVEGIERAVKIKLKEVSEALKVDVKLKS